MDISTRAEFDATTEQVFTMLTTEEYLREVCRASQAEPYDVKVAGSTSRTERTLPAPAAAAKFTGPTLPVVEEIVWGDESDGARDGTITITVPGQPVTMNGTVRLTPSAAGTVFEVAGNLRVNIPMLGKKLEQSAAPAVLAGVDVHQEIGERWLAEHR